MTCIPENPKITTRRAHTARRQRIPFEPVYVPGDTRRNDTSTLGSFAGVLFLFVILACVAAYVGGFNG